MEEKKEGVLTVPLRSISIWQRSLMECIPPGVSFCCGPATSLPVGKKRKVVEIFSTSRYIELTGGPNEAYFSIYAFRIHAGPLQVLNDTQVSHSERIQLWQLWLFLVYVFLYCFFKFMEDLATLSTYFPKIYLVQISEPGNRNLDETDLRKQFSVFKQKKNI